MLQQEQTQREEGCLRALRASPLLAVWLPGLRANLELAQLKALPPPLLALDTVLQGGLSQGWYRSLRDLLLSYAPSIWPPSELKLLLCRSHACPWLWAHCSGPRPGPAVDFQPDLRPALSPWTCPVLTGLCLMLVTLTGPSRLIWGLWGWWDSCCLTVLSSQLTFPCREPALAAPWQAVPLKISTAFKDPSSQEKCQPIFLHRRTEMVESARNQTGHVYCWTMEGAKLVVVYCFPCLGNNN